MQALSGSVGERGTNTINDVVLLQAILLKTRREAIATSPAGPYLASYYGICGDGTKAAILAYQTDHVFVSNDGTQSVDNPKATAGLVAPNDATWTKLIEKVGAILPTCAYWPAARPSMSQRLRARCRRGPPRSTP